jgi:hypothetical protein
LLPTKEAEHSLRREKGKRYRKSEAAVRYTKLFLPLLHHEIMDLEGSLVNAPYFCTNSIVLFGVPSRGRGMFRPMILARCMTGCNGEGNQHLGPWLKSS